MSDHQYTATISWQRNDAEFSRQRYSRAHRWIFDGGVEVPASSSPQVVRVPYSDENAVDPEEAFIASLASCHMLFFLHHAAKRGFIVDAYQDDAVGSMGKNENGRIAMRRVVLRPSVTWGGSKLPTSADIDELHHLSHDDCFIANSVTTEIVVEQR